MPGVHAQLNADPEFRPEADHVLPVTLVELDAQDHQLKLVPAELLLVRYQFPKDLSLSLFFFIFLSPPEKKSILQDPTEYE